MGYKTFCTPNKNISVKYNALTGAVQLVCVDKKKLLNNITETDFIGNNDNLYDDDFFGDDPVDPCGTGPTPPPTPTAPKIVNITRDQSGGNDDIIIKLNQDPNNITSYVAAYNTGDGSEDSKSILPPYTPFKPSDFTNNATSKTATISVSDVTDAINNKVGPGTVDNTKGSFVFFARITNLPQSRGYVSLSGSTPTAPKIVNITRDQSGGNDDIIIKLNQDPNNITSYVAAYNTGDGSEDSKSILPPYTPFKPSDFTNNATSKTATISVSDVTDAINNKVGPGTVDNTKGSFVFFARITNLPQSRGYVKLGNTLDNIVNIAVGEESLSNLVKLLIETDNVNTISELNNITVFAPIDEAFNKISNITDTLSEKEVVTVLLSHVVPFIIKSEDIFDGYTVTTISGSNIVFKVNNKGVFICSYDDNNYELLSESKIIATDIIASNGIVHLLDGVIIPKL